MTTDPAEESDLLERAGDAAGIAGRLERAEALLRRGAGIARERGDRRATARNPQAAWAACCSANDGLPTRSESLREPGPWSSPTWRPIPGLVALESQLARSHFLFEDLRLSVEVADRVLEAAEHLDLPEILADTLVTKATALGGLGRLTEGNGLIEIGQRLAESMGLAAPRSGQ